jgi:aspartate kinase
LIVAKFGGSSVRDASAFKRCLEIIKKQDTIKLVILSATYNSTNELEEIYELSIQGSKLQEEKYQSLIKRHQDLAIDLGIDNEIVDLFFDKIDIEYRTCQRKDDYLALGELMSSTLFYHYLNIHLTDAVSLEFRDARELIKTDSQFGMAVPNEDKIKTACHQLVKENSLIITQGFIGSDEMNRTTTLGREGSDYSASLLAAAIGASGVQIWTDVDGVYSADPRLVKEAKPIKNLSYLQAAMLAKNGAKVLYPKTLAPLLSQNIPVYVKSSLFPEKVGSLIDDDEATFCAVTSKKNQDSSVDSESEFIISVIGPHLTDKKISQYHVSEKLHLETLSSLHQKYCL